MAILIECMGLPECCDNCKLCSVEWTEDDSSTSWAYCHPASRLIITSHSGSDREVATKLLEKPDWCPIRGCNRLMKEISGKTPEEIYDLLFIRMKRYGLSFTNSRNAIIDWLNGETRYDYLLGDEYNGSFD